MAIFCTQYLTSAAFSHSRTADEIRDAALSGYYGAIDYAAACWKKHVHEAYCATVSNQDLDEQTRNTLLQSARGLLEAEARSRRALQPRLQSEQAPTSEQLPEHSEAPTLSELLADNSKSVFVNQRVTAIRHVIELIELPSSNAFTELNGIGRFKCPRVECCKFSDGFLFRQERQNHLIEHERPFKCAIDGCYSSTVGYSSQQALDAHFERLHSSESTVEDLFPRSNEADDPTLFSAAAKGDLERVKSLHASGTPLNEPDRPKGWLTPLIIASRNGHAKVCQYLIQQGENPFSAGRSTASGSALVEAIRRKDHELIQLMRLTTRSKPTIEEIGFAIAYAICNGMAMDCELLLKDATEMEYDPEELLLEILNGSCSIPKGLRIQNAQITAIQKSLIKSIFRLTLPALYPPPAHGPFSEDHSYPDPEAEMQRQRLWELVVGNESTSSIGHRFKLIFKKYVRYFIEVLLDLFEQDNKIDIDVGYHILYEIVRPSGSNNIQNSLDVAHTVSRILRGTGGAAANKKDSYGDLPLHDACRRQNGCVAVIPLLIQHTTNLDEENDSGNTPLEEAINAVFVRGVSLLVESDRVNLGRKNRNGETMYEYAQRLKRERNWFKEDREKIVQLLKPQEERSTEDETARTD